MRYPTGVKLKLLRRLSAYELRIDQENIINIRLSKVQARVGNGWVDIMDPVRYSFKPQENVWSASKMTATFILDELFYVCTVTVSDRQFSP